MTASKSCALCNQIDSEEENRRAEDWDWVEGEEEGAKSDCSELSGGKFKYARRGREGATFCRFAGGCSRAMLLLLLIMPIPLLVLVLLLLVRLRASWASGWNSAAAREVWTCEEEEEDELAAA
jgi:hypothetical protein